MMRKLSSCLMKPSKVVPEAVIDHEGVPIAAVEILSEEAQLNNNNGTSIGLLDLPQNVRMLFACI